MSRGNENRSLNHATRYSLLRLRTLFASASLVARAKAEIRDNNIHEYDINYCSVNENSGYFNCRCNYSNPNKYFLKINLFY